MSGVRPTENLAMKIIPAIALILVTLLIAPDSRARQGISPKSEPITSITLERKGCNGPCPVDRVTFRPDGNHTYVGIRHVERLGTYKPKAKDKVFDVMVKVLERLDFFSLENNYVRSNGIPVTVISVTRGGETKTVRFSEKLNDPPIEIVIISGYIEPLMLNLDWEKVSDSTSPA